METNKTTSLRISVATNKELSKLVKSWAAKSKVDLVERIVLYQSKMGINPYDSIPETLGAKVLKRVDQIIAFIRTNEKRQLENMEQVITIARDKLDSVAPPKGRPGNDEMTELLTSRLSILGDKEAIRAQLLKASRRYTEFLINDLLTNPASENKSPDHSKAFRQFIDAINKILD